MRLGEMEEDDMDDETEEDAIERIKEELSEKYEGEVSQIEGVQVLSLYTYSAGVFMLVPPFSYSPPLTFSFHIT